MPLFEFYCAKCEAEFEEIVRADAFCPPCPHCGSTDTKKKICAPNPQLKNPFPFKPAPPVPKPKPYKP